MWPTGPGNKMSLFLQGIFEPKNSSNHHDIFSAIDEHWKECYRQYIENGHFLRAVSYHTAIILLSSTVTLMKMVLSRT